MHKPSMSLSSLSSSYIINNQIKFPTFLLFFPEHKLRRMFVAADKLLHVYTDKHEAWRLEERESEETRERESGERA